MPMRKISRCQQDFIELIYKLADICNLKDIEYIIEFGSEDVDSYLGGTYKVQIKGCMDGQRIKKTIVIKWHPDSKMRSCFRESYKREYVFYRHIAPKLLEIQRSFKIIEGLKIRIPNCIYASDEYDKETIAVLGLEEDRFRLHCRLHKADLEHVSLVMKNLAKLHALSFVLAKTNPSVFEKIAQLCHPDVQYSNPGMPPKSMKSYYDASVDVVSDPVAREKLRQLAPNILTALYKCTQSNPYSAICHGDCWNNNMFFKYKGTRPVEVIFIDYQLTRIASPVTDISYFLYMSTERDFLTKHYYHIIDIYYGTLTAVLRQCGLDVEEVYPRKIFRQHLKEYSVLGLIEALISMMIITAPSEEALKMTEVKYEYSNDEVNEDEWDHGLFVDRVNGVVDDFFGKGYSEDAILNK